MQINSGKPHNQPFLPNWKMSKDIWEKRASLIGLEDIWGKQGSDWKASFFKNMAFLTKKGKKMSYSKNHANDLDIRVIAHTSAVLSRFAESDAFGLPKGRISFSRPRQTGDFNEASRDCIQFKFPCIRILAM